VQVGGGFLFLTLERLCERAGNLSNHIRRYIRVVEKHQEQVVSRLEETGNAGRISFGDASRNLPREMDIISRVARNENERRDFLAFYYALQYIIMEIHSLNLLKYHLTTEPQLTAFGRCISYARSQFRVLTATYLDTLAQVLVPPRLGDHFALLGVGTMGDRDDIDVAVVDDLDDASRPELSQALARLSQAMLRTSCTLHFHMAEALGSPGLTASLDRYVAFTQQKPYNPVTISQMICAQHLTGDKDLGTRFVRQVTGRFFFHPGLNDHDHEGFLRAMLGELQEMLHRPVSAQYINPKEDGLRLIKGYLALTKSIHHVPHSDWSAVLDYLEYRNSRFRAEFSALQRGHTYLETVRYLYQLLVVEEETIDTRDGGGKSPVLEELAGVMGYRPQGGLDAHVPFLMAYYETVDGLRNALRTLLAPVEDHLRSITSLSFFFFPAELDSMDGNRNLALRHVSESRRFFGTRYWNDLLDEFSREGSPIPDRYLRDLDDLSPPRQEIVLKGLVEWGVLAPASFLRFFVPIHEYSISYGFEPLSEKLVDLFLDRCRDEPLIAERFAAIYDLWPARVHGFLQTLDPDRLVDFQQLVKGKIEKKELRESGDTLVHLVNIHRYCSRWYKQMFCAAVDHHDEAFRQLKKPAELHATADALYGQAERFSDLFSRREWMEIYYRLETTRLGLDFLEGKPYPQLLREYRIGMHILLRSLYFLCRKELYDLYQMEWSDRHSIGLYIDTGCTGFHPLDPDLRVMVLLYRDDTEIERFFSQVATSFQKELGRLGITIRSFPESGEIELTPRRLDTQRSMLEERAERCHDQLELLSMYKFNRIVGTRGHLERFTTEVINPVIASVRESAPRLMREYLQNRDDSLSELREDQPVDPRTMPGGVQDLERFYLFLCALRGEGPLCSGSGAGCAGCADNNDRTGNMSVLRENMVLLQVLATARRLLRGGDPDSGIDAAFVRSQEPLLACRSELSPDLFGNPVGHLMRLARKNLEMMKILIKER
jgi:hypothetical protein